jgi:hypothetical protein
MNIQIKNENRSLGTAFILEVGTDRRAIHGVWRARPTKLMRRRKCRKSFGNGINRHFKRLVVIVFCLWSGCLLSWGNDKIVDVNMLSPYVPLPFYLEVKLPQFASGAVVADGHVLQESGPKAEVMTAYRAANLSWPVWAKLPDQTGEFVFTKEADSVRVKVTDDDKQSFLRTIVLQSVKGAALSPEIAKPILIQKAVELPIASPVKQISGPTAVFLKDKGGGEKVWVKIPDQVCTLVFETEGKSDRAVVRVWADKDKRCFVSSRKGDDANPGTEDKPFKSLHHAFKYVKDKMDKKGGIYMAGGEYDLGDEKLTLDYQVSVFGGFDENGWRRDPIITESVLLPHAFCENWINEITDRYKDIRRGEPRYHETIILRRTMKKMGTILIGGGNGYGTLQIAGTPDTYIDGITVYGTDEHSRGDITPALDNGNQNKRTIRNCIIVHFCGAGHNFMTGSGGACLYENNLVSGGIDSALNNSRPDITGDFGHWNRNLILGPTGGAYTRIINMWGEGGLFTENQIHGGLSTQWSGMQAGHGAALAQRLKVFRKNLFYMDYLFKYCVSTGVIMEDNEIHLFQGGVDHKFIGSKALTIRNNHFYLAPGVDKEKLWSVKEMTHKLGGTFVFENNEVEREQYVEPEGEGTGSPIIENNEYSIMEKPDRRIGNFIDLKKLMAHAEKVGEGAWLRPKDPAKNLKAQATGDTVSLTWDESVDSDVSGYIVRYGQKSNSYQNPTFFGKVKSAEIKNLQPGSWYFTVVPIKEGNVECWKLSNEVQVMAK